MKDCIRRKLGQVTKKGLDSNLGLAEINSLFFEFAMLSKNIKNKLKNYY